jgi:peptide deformylase
MAEPLEIALVGNPILRQEVKKIDDFSSPELQTLIDNMLLVMREKKGVGIAAPQLSESKRLLIVALPNTDPIIMINPIMLNQSSELVKGWEGCFSLPEFFAVINRSVSVHIEFTGIDGKRYKEYFENILARIFAHEIDHLDGKDFVMDRYERGDWAAAAPEYFKRYRGKPIPPAIDPVPEIVG